MNNTNIQILALIVGAITALIFAIIVLDITVLKPRAKARKIAEEEYEAKLHELIKQAQEFLQGRHFLVYLRTRENKKSGLESDFISALISLGVVVKPVPEDDLKRIVSADFEPLKKGNYAVIVYFWFQDCRYHFDYRLITKNDDGDGKVLFSGWAGCSDGRTDQFFTHTAQKMVASAIYDVLK